MGGVTALRRLRRLASEPFRFGIAESFSDFAAYILGNRRGAGEFEKQLCANLLAVGRRTDENQKGL